MNHLELSVNQYCNAFGSEVLALAKNESAQRLTPIYSGFISSTNNRRANFLNIIIGEDTIELLDEDFEISLRDQDGNAASGSDRDLIDAYTNFVITTNMNYVASDVGQFTEAALRTKNGIRLQRIEAFKPHAQEIAKYAMGAFVGTWLARRLS